MEAPIPSSNLDSTYNSLSMDAAPVAAFEDFSFLAGENVNGSVDPALLQPTSATTPTSFNYIPSNGSNPSLAISPTTVDAGRIGVNRKSRSNSPHFATNNWQPYPLSAEAKRNSSLSFGHRSGSSDDENEKGRCPFPECGKVFKDLKAHILTHQNERPEKCPIPSCEYNKKGFSRKYDKNRHTLTHYKGTMICGFCPGSGSSAEKSFNRADVFKRHLTTVHGVEQAPPNSRRKSLAPSKKAGAPHEKDGKCSICSQIFATPQSFYEHLEDCVLSVVQKVDPSEAINEQILSSMDEDEGFKKTIERYNCVDVTHINDDDEDSENENETTTYGDKADS